MHMNHFLYLLYFELLWKGCNCFSNYNFPWSWSLSKEYKSISWFKVEIKIIEIRNRDSFTANVKKNINKLKAQAQAMISTEDSPEEEGNDEEELSEEEDDDSEEYAIQKIGWKCISSFPIPYITEHILSLSMYLFIPSSLV